MAVSPSFRNFVLEQVRSLVPVTTRPMFGGLTLFHGGRAFALLDDDRIYLKVDALSRGAFEALGTGPFLPFGDPLKPMASYHELPGELLEDAEALEPWVRRALAAAERAPAPRSRKKA
jgi:DNA transformation protein and related proteins